MCTKLERPHTIAFYMPVRLHSAWAALLASFQKSDMEVRKLGLADVNTLLHDFTPNALSLVSIAVLQLWSPLASSPTALMLGAGAGGKRVIPERARGREGGTNPINN